MTKLKTSNCDYLKPRNVTKLKNKTCKKKIKKNSNCDKTKKTQTLTKLKNSNCDKTQNSNFDKKKKKLTRLKKL